MKKFGSATGQSEKILKPSGEFQSYVVALLDYLRDSLSLSHFRAQVEFCDEDRTTDLPGSPTGQVVLDVSSDPVYHWMQVRVYPYAEKEYFDRGRLADLALYCVHEMVHAATDEVANLALDAAAPHARPFVLNAVERQTQALAEVLHEMLPRDYWLPENVI